MPKATITFNLPDEKEEYKLAMSAGKLHCALYDLYTWLRADTKYGEGKYEEVYTKFWEILRENDVDLFD